MGKVKRAVAGIFEWLESRVPPLAWLALAAVAGIFLANALENNFEHSEDTGLWLWATASSAAGVIFLRHRRNVALATVVACCYGLMHALSLANMAQVPHRAALLAGQRFQIEVTGVIDDAPWQTASFLPCI